MALARRMRICTHRDSKCNTYTHGPTYHTISM